MLYKYGGYYIIPLYTMNNWITKLNGYCEPSPMEWDDYDRYAIFKLYAERGAQIVCWSLFIVEQTVLCLFIQVFPSLVPMKKNE